MINNLEVAISPELLQYIQELAEQSGDSLNDCVEYSLWKLIPVLKQEIVMDSSFGLADRISESEKLNLLHTY